MKYLTSHKKGIKYKSRSGNLEETMAEIQGHFTRDYIVVPFIQAYRLYLQLYK